MRRKRRAPKPRRGSVERLHAELAHAARKADEWTTKVKAAVTNLHYWNRRERKLAAAIAAWPKPPRPAKPKPPIRAIKFGGAKDATDG